MIASQISQLPARRSGTKQFFEKKCSFNFMFLFTTILQLYCGIIAVGPKTKTKKTLGLGRIDAYDWYEDRNHMRWEEETSTL